jgi:thioesterase domain-containing protein
MLVHDLLVELKSKGIIISLNENGDLSVSAPKGAMTAVIAQQIKANKPDIVAFLGVNAAKDALAAFPPIVHIDHGRFVPISLAQERLWLLEEMTPDTPIYNLQYAYRLQGALDVAAFEAALEWVVDRHEVLRLRFDTVDDQPTGIISDEVDPILAFVSLDEIPAAEQEEMVQTLLREQGETPVDLAIRPLFRAVLYQLSPKDFVFSFLVHHIVFDGWSAEVFWDDLVFAYQNPDPDAGRGPLIIQYSDYADWQRNWLDSEAVEKDKVFWQENLRDPVAPLEIPGARKQSSHVSFYAVEKQKIVIPSTLTAKIKRLAQQMKATPFMVLLAAYKATLHAYTGQEDLVVGSPVAGRPVTELEALIGYFNNVVVFRSNLGQDPTFKDLLTQEKSVVLKANEHQAIPFQHIADLPSVSHIPLMRAMFVLQNQIKPVPNLPGISVSPVSVADEYGYSDMSIELTEKDGVITGSLWFKSALIDGKDMAQFIDNYLTMLAAVTEHPERPLSAYPQFEMPIIVDDVVVENVGAAERPFTPPRDELEAKLALIWGELLGYEPVSVYDDFFETGGHSLLAIRLFDQFERFAGRKLPLSLLFKAPTIAGLAEYIRDEEQDIAISSMVMLSDPDPTLNYSGKRPFYCVTPPGDELLVFNSLVRAFGEERPFIGLQYGVNGEKPFLSVEGMAAYFVEQIIDQDNQEPYLIGGYCYGGLLAYEMAQQLRAQGKEVALVVMIDTSVPGAVTEKKKTLRNLFNNNVSKMQEEGVSSEVQHVVNRTAEVFRGELWHPFWGKMQQRYAERNDAVPTALRSFHYINEQAEKQYQVKSYPGAVVLIQAKIQYPKFDYPLHLGWDKYVTGSFVDHRAPGDHRSLLNEPHVSTLAEILKESVESAAHKTQTAVQITN